MTLSLPLTLPDLPDCVSLVSAATRFDSPIPCYDDSWGPLWIHRDSMGISGIVRAKTWSDAYSICEDEFFPAGDAEAGAEAQRIEALPEGEERNHAQACWDEAYGYRPSGNSKMPDGSLSSIYAKDLNGDRLDPLTQALVDELGLKLTFSHEH
jgi:hypothetical protein